MINENWLTPKEAKAGKSLFKVSFTAEWTFNVGFIKKPSFMISGICSKTCKTPPANAPYARA